jgi:nucleoside-diphosphate-sugar epimerase
MKVLVTCESGQLGREITRQLRRQGAEVTGIDRESLDFARPAVGSDRCNREQDWLDGGDLAQMGTLGTAFGPPIRLYRRSRRCAVG